MKRLVVSLASLLAAIGCASPTGPSRDAARAEKAKAALQSASAGPTASSPGKIATN